jgi:hypothetical protein
MPLRAIVLTADDEELLAVARRAPKGLSMPRPRAMLPRRTDGAARAVGPLLSQGTGAVV